MHTYIHNRPLQPFSQDYGLASHNTHVVYVSFIREWRHLQFNVDYERQIFEKLFSWQIYLWCFLFCKEDLTLLEDALKKLLTIPVIM